MIATRAARPTDAAYIAATALHQVHRFVRHVTREELELVVRAMLNESAIVVACSETDDDTLFGWCAAVGGVPWFCFVARELRGHGIGARLRLEVTRGRGIDPASERPAHRQPDAGDDSLAAVAARLGFVRGVHS
jgi:GNAT superfamily N-acetyltransferase